jgi:hypothetical protein
MPFQEVHSNIETTSINLDVGFYDPFSIFQGGFRSNFEKHIKIPSFYWKDNHDVLRILKNLHFNFVEEIPNNKSKDINYLKFMFISCQSIDDYRAKVRPLVLQWLNSNKSITPKIPYFIFFFENTELRTTADKYLKTNLFNKLKLDFDNKEFKVENIFKIKSFYSTDEDRIEVWKTISTSTKSLLSLSINTQLEYHKNNLVSIAAIFKHLDQYQDALACYSKLFNLFPYITKRDFANIDLTEILEIFNSTNVPEKPNNDSKFSLKCWYYKNQEMLLSDKNLTDIVYIKNMYRLAQTLLSFLTSIEMCYKRNEISYIMIQKYLSNKRLWKLIEQHQNNNRDIITIIGNLKLLQRNELIALGTSKAYYVKGSMSVIDLQFSTDNYEIKEEYLNSIFETEEKFIHTIIDLTRDLISIYDQSSINMNTLAILSTELALILYYSTDDYETSCNQLVKSYEFFSSNGWKYIGVTLLEVYIENLDNLINEHGPIVISQLISSYVTLGANKSTKFDSKRFRELCSKLSSQKVLKSNDLLNLRSISSVYCDNVDIYKIDIRLKSKLHFKIDKIKLLLKNENGNIIEFYCDDIEIAEDNEITLQCLKLCFDDYEVSNIIIDINKFEIIQDVNMKIHLNTIESFYDTNQKQLKKNTKVSMKVPRRRFLHYDHLLFEVEVGSNPITDIEMIFIKTDPDKLSKQSEYKIVKIANDKYEPLDFEVDETEKQISFKLKNNQPMNSGNIISLQIPYFFPPYVSKTLLDVWYNVNFTSISGSKNVPIKCSRKCFSQIESLLPVAVAANEIFRSSNVDKNIQKDPEFSLFSHFTVNSISVGNPVRIQNINVSSKNSKVETWKCPKNVIAFMDQGATYFYKISEFNDKEITLKIEYNSIKDEIIQYMDIAFERYLEKQGIGKNDFFLFISTAHKIWESLKYKCNFYALTEKIIPIDYKIENIDNFLKYINIKHRLDYKKHVQTFIDSLNNIDVDNEFRIKLFERTKHELLISVTLPTINMINVVKYHFKKELQYLVCEPINIKVTIDVQLLKLSRDQIEEFDKSTDKKVRFQNNNENDEEFNLEPEVVGLDLKFIDNDQKWIVSGIKNLFAKINLRDTLKNKGSHFEFDLTFIPLKPGKLQLPAIEVKNTNRKNLVMEIDYKNTSESVLVVSELNKIIHSF